jgi:hypothetical protein
MAARAEVTSPSINSATPRTLQATERADRLEDNQDAPWVASQMAQLHIPLDDHD